MKEELGTSNVENNRYWFEEFKKYGGGNTPVLTIWRDSNHIPDKIESPLIASSTDSDGTQYKTALSIKDGSRTIIVVKYYEGILLNRVSGTKNVFYSEKLKDVILPYFGDCYIPKIYINDNPLAFGLGNPYFDIDAGTVTFDDTIELTDDIEIKISFFKYAGRKGTIKSLDDNVSPDLPFRDDIKHFHNVNSEKDTATIQVRGDGESKYILAPTNGKHYAKEEADKDSSVILTQESLEDVLWVQNTKISGGEWRENNVIHRY
jgi:hypothetical protein